MAFDPDQYLSEKSAQAQPAHVQGFDPDAYLQQKTGAENSANPSSLADSINAAKTGVRSALETITLGASEPMFGAIHSVDKTFQQGIRALADKIKGAGGNDFDVIEALKNNYLEDVAQRKKDVSEHPTANVIGAIGGAFVPAGPAAALTEKAGELVGRGAKVVADSVPNAGRALSYAGRVTRGAAEGAATGIALETPRRAIENASGYEEQNPTSISDIGKVGAIVGATIPGAAPAVKYLAKKSASTGKKLITTLLGPSEEHIDYYLKNPDAVNNAKSITELKDRVDNITEGLRDAVNNGEMSVAEARAHLRDIEQATAQHRANSNLEFNITHTQVKQQLRQASEDLDKALTESELSLKDAKPPVELADEAVQATRDLKDKVIKGSQEATSLIKDGNTVDLFQPYNQIKQIRESLNIAGRGPATPEAQKAAGAIENLMKMVGSLPGKLSGKEAKALIKQLDQSEQAIYNSGEFTGEVSQAYKTLRQGLDAQLKAQNPEYAKAMEAVSANRKLMEAAAPFQDRASAISKLNRIAGPTSAVDRETLSALGKATGRDFESPIASHIEAQGKLKDPRYMQSLEESLPEHASFKSAQRDARLFEGPEAKNEYLNRTLEDSGLPSKQSAAESNLAAKQAELDAAKAKLEPFKNINPRNSQSTLERGMRATDSAEGQIQLKRQLSDLSKMSDVDFEKELKALRTKEAFTQRNMNGSRNVNLFSIVATAAGSGAAGFAAGGPLGAAIGAGMGAIVDRFGPQIAKSILDGVIKMEGSPTLSKIRALNIPPEAKAYLSNEYARFSEGATANAKMADEPKKGPSKWANDGFEKLMEHAKEKGQSFNGQKGAMISDPKTKQLLIAASDLKPGSKAMDQIMAKIKSRGKK